MPLFLITFLSLYGGMHVYGFIRLRAAFPINQPALSILAGVMGLLTVAPLIVRLAEANGLERTALWIAWPAYIWMGSIFIFCSFLLALDAVRWVAWLACRYSGAVIPGFLTSVIACEFALLLAILTSVYAVYEARRIRTEHVTVSTTKLAPGIARLRIVQISDVHLGLLFRESRLESVLKVVREAHPDILVSTGDLVDGRLSREDVVSRMNRLAGMIAAVPARVGKFAVAGNHEFYAGIGPALDLTRAAGFTVLRNQSQRLPEGIIISGVDDPAGDRGAASAAVHESELLKLLPSDQFHLLLKHRPVLLPSSDGRFDLQLSGHVHKGQIFPFNLLVRLRFPIPVGTSPTAARSLIHVSRGSGTWGPPMRLLAPPEVTIIDVVAGL